MNVQQAEPITGHGREDSFSQFWSRLPWISRNSFRDPNESDGAIEAFEPARSRNGLKSEFHIATAIGCDWKCGFCTEAQINGGNGETRRSVADIVGEIQYLLQTSDPVLGVSFQFIEDNVLPPIAAKRAVADSKLTKERIQYSAKFLEQLQIMQKSLGSFKWRGLMRIEDFLAYEAEIPKFASLLSQSGCWLLGFGVESGHEQLRQALKGGAKVLSNSEISDVVTRLQAVRIMIKAYFMVGEPKNLREKFKVSNKDDSLLDATISFAIDSGIDVAYFSIYKDFSSVVNAERLSRKGTLNQPPHSYQVLQFDLQKFVAEELMPSTWKAQFGKSYESNEIALFREQYASLTRNGFKFEDLFKYNDYMSTTVGDVRVGGEAHLRDVRRAYLEYYGRPASVDAFRRLVSQGY
jgi:radical SAM superfamily enzyme YgiQ (UPF0313 family)